MNERRPLRIPNPFDDPIRRGLMGVMRPAMERVLRLPDLNDVYEQSVDRGEPATMTETLLDELGARFEIADGELGRVPKEGPLVVVANHPFGGVEGLVIDALLRRARPDVKTIANFLLSSLPAIRDRFFFVDPFDRPQSARNNMRSMREALRWVRDGHALAVFPAGEVSHASLKTRAISDPPWDESAARIALRNRAPVLPVYFDGRNSLRFQLLGLVHPRLRTIMLPAETLRKRDQTIRVVMGSLIPADRLAEFGDAAEANSYLRVRTYLLKNRLAAVERAAREGSRQLLTADAEDDDLEASLIRQAKEVADLPEDALLTTSHPFEVYVARAHQIPDLLMEIARLRELTFRAAGEGTGKEIDTDRFDHHYLHLFVWHREKQEVVGAYRLGPTDEILPRHGVDGLYTSTLFNYGNRLMRQIDPALELGRSFVRQEYQRSHSPLLLLWRGLGRFACRNPRYRKLFGPVSISNDYQSMTKQLLIQFLQSTQYVSVLGRLIKPRKPVRLRPIRHWDPAAMSVVVRDLEDVDELVREIEADRRSVPVLVRQYLKLNAKLLGFNVDPDFGDVVDGLMLVDLTEVDRRILKFYMGEEGVDAYLAAHGLGGEG